MINIWKRKRKLMASDVFVDYYRCGFDNASTAEYRNMTCDFEVCNDSMLEKTTPCEASASGCCF